MIELSNKSDLEEYQLLFRLYNLTLEKHRQLTRIELNLMEYMYSQQGEYTHFLFNSAGYDSLVLWFEFARTTLYTYKYKLRKKGWITKKGEFTDEIKEILKCLNQDRKVLIDINMVWLDE